MIPSLSQGRSSTQARLAPNHPSSTHADASQRNTRPCGVLGPGQGDRIAEVARSKPAGRISPAPPSRASETPAHSGQAPRSAPPQLRRRPTARWQFTDTAPKDHASRGSLASSPPCHRTSPINAPARSVSRLRHRSARQRLCIIHDNPCLRQSPRAKPLPAANPARQRPAAGRDR